VVNRSLVEPFAQYNTELAGHLAATLDGSPVDSDALAQSLDGGCAQRLRELVPRPYRREVGAFFTPSVHRAEVASALADLPPGPYLDPMCGAGDLLLAASRFLGEGPDLQATIEQWSARLFGWDIHPEFIRAAKLRLLLAAASRNPVLSAQSFTEPDQYALPGIQADDATIRLLDRQIERTIILINPPYGSCLAPENCEWASGMVSKAALYMQKVIDATGPDCHVVALLPDVLRTGDRYARWRTMIEERTSLTVVKSLGIFDKYTDVDVFLLSARRLSTPIEGRKASKSSVEWWRPSCGNHGTIGDRFSIHVGPVVDNRDPHEGPEFPFMIARDLPQQGEAGIPMRVRRFSGRLFTPPFVLLRRTSRPTINDGTRAPGVLITGQDAVAIDNHLLVARPHDGTVDACRRLLLTLQAESTTSFLDQRLRCRHLTVKAVQEIPWVPTGPSTATSGD
jgi:N-6 DNA Methylase